MAKRKLDAALAEWAVSAIEPGGTLLEARGLRDGGSPWLLRIASGEHERAAVLRVGNGDDREAIRRERSALELAESHGIPVPGVLAMRDDVDPPLLLIDRVHGNSAIPRDRPSSRLRALGAVAARLHGIPAPPSSMRRTRPIASVDFAELRRQAPPQPLLQQAEHAVAQAPPSSSADGFVHGDLWQGNTLWSQDSLVGVIDWDCAGVGPAGVDLGSLRCDAALCFGMDATADVLAAWETAAGRAASDVAYWDVVAALSTPPDLAWFVQAISAQGRPDLAHPLLVARRDEFLSAALERVPTP